MSSTEQLADSFNQPDDALRHALRTSVAMPPSIAEQANVHALQSRILAEWSARQPAQVPLVAGSEAVRGGTSGKRRQWQLQMGFAALALIAVIAFQATQSGRDTNVDDLLEPDVLALMAMGEL